MISTLNQKVPSVNFGPRSMQNLEKSPKLSHTLGSSKAPDTSVRKRDKLGSSFYFNSDVSFSHACSHMFLAVPVPKRSEHTAHIKRDQATEIALLLFPFPPGAGVGPFQCETISSGKWPNKQVAEKIIVCAHQLSPTACVPLCSSRVVVQH